MSPASFTYGSVCSGIEAATMAWHPLGWRPAFVSEIEAFPRAVLKHHWPEVPLHGDFTTIKAGQYRPINLLVGGTPCQSFSVAGLRGGLGDDRGNLALEYIRLAERLRPEWVVWENVPGVFSSSGGEDFRCFLSGLVRWDVPIPAGGWQNSGVIGAGPVDGAYGVAWRTLDAQFFGVAQRRRRVFVVGYTGDWRRAAAVLFEPEGLSGHPAPRRQAGQRAARPIAAGSRSSSGYRNDADTADNLVAGTLNANGKAAGSATQQDAESGLLVAEVAPALRARHNASHRLDSDAYVPVAFGGNNTSGPIDVAPSLLAQPGSGFKCDFDSETFIAEPLAPALTSNPYGDHESREGLLVAHAFDARQSDVIQYGDMTGPLDTEGGSVAVCFTAKDHGQDAEFDIAPTLRSGNHDGSHQNGGVMPAVAYSIRRDATREGVAKTPSADAAGNVRLRNPGLGIDVDVSATLDTGAPHAVAFALRGREGGALPEMSGDQVGALRAASGGSSRDYVAFDPQQVTSPGNRSNPQPGAPCQSLAASAHAPAVAFTVVEQANGFAWERDIYPTLQAKRDSDTSQRQVGVRIGAAVRRLTPRECERLQGFADDYTLIPAWFKGAPKVDAEETARWIMGRPPTWMTPEELRVAWERALAAARHPDGPRYKALGNSMAVPVMAWIGRRIAMVNALELGA